MIRRTLQALQDWLAGWLAVRAWRSAAREQRRAQAEAAGTFRTTLTGRRIDLRPMVCGRRFDGYPVHDWPPHTARADHWRTGGGLVTQGAVGVSCSYCGSLHPDVLMDKLRAGWTLEGTDKSYKWYLADLDGRTVAKFYTVHLHRAACEELLRALGDETIKHSLYIRPWLPALASTAPSWLTGG